MINPKYVLMITAILPGLVFAGSNTNKGANPNGKPFIELGDQIIEVEGEISTLQDQVDSLVDDVDDLTLRIGANEVAIADLEAANTNLQTQITANAGEIGSLEAEVDILEADNADLQVQINALGDADGSLQDAIDTNTGLITTLNQTISDLGVSLQDQIDNNSELIAIMQDSIDHLSAVGSQQTDIVNGVCPEGQTVSHYNSATDTFYCFRRILSHDGSEAEYPVAYKTLTIAAGRIMYLNVSCPTSYTPGNLFVRNFSYSQSGGVELLNVWNYTRYYHMRFRNTTSEAQVVNMAVECTYFW